jgi:hypothetical protein
LVITFQNQFWFILSKQHQLIRITFTRVYPNTNQFHLNSLLTKINSLKINSIEINYIHRQTKHTLSLATKLLKLKKQPMTLYKHITWRPNIQFCLKFNMIIFDFTSILFNMILSCKIVHLYENICCISFSL